MGLDSLIVDGNFGVPL